MRIRKLFHIMIVAASFFLSSFALANDVAKPHQFTLPEGFSSQCIAGPSLVSHPTMGCFDDVGRFFVCDGAGVNMSAAELEEHLPNHITMLEDQDGDGTFEKSTIFADKMTFPMGAAWYEGALFVASPPNIWRLEDTTGDGIADKRDIIVDSFGYTGNAASIHGCFFSPDGRMYWCDGYHGHEFKDDEGNITSKRKGSYIFSCWPDGSDVRIHCGGGMDNPVEVDFTEEGDVIGTVNILYNRPRVDCLVHWQYGGAYPHREAVLDELKVTGDLLGPIHRFGHVAVSGTTRYRSGMMDGGWDNNFFVTQFNLGKIVRVELERHGSTYSCTERQFLSCSNRDFHPTDVIEDADGSLIVIDTGGWFYRGCPTSQIAKPDVPGGIYRIRRDDMPVVTDPRGNGIDWNGRSSEQLISDLADERFVVREKAIQECVRRGDTMIDSLIRMLKTGNTMARRNALWAITRVMGALDDDSRLQVQEMVNVAIIAALSDREPSVRQTVWRGIGAGVLSRRIGPLDFREATPFETSVQWSDALEGLVNGTEKSAAVRRTAFASLSSRQLTRFNCFAGIQDADGFRTLDREERHAILYGLLTSVPRPHQHKTRVSHLLTAHPEYLIVMNQLYTDGVNATGLSHCLMHGNVNVALIATSIVRKGIATGRFSTEELQQLDAAADARLQKQIGEPDRDLSLMSSIIQTFVDCDKVASTVAKLLAQSNPNDATRMATLKSLASADSVSLHPSWKQPLQNLLSSDEPAKKLAAIQAAGSIGAAHFAPVLTALVHSPEEAVPIRTASLRAVAADRSLFNMEGVFTLLVRLTKDGIPAEQITASQLLSVAPLTSQQLKEVAPLLQDAGPGQLIDLVPLFKGRLPVDLAVSFLDNLENARSLSSLPTIYVSEVVKRFPPELHDRANALLDRMHAQEQQKLLKLDSLIDELKTGNADRGKAVFFSEKAKCSTCHVVGRNEAGELLGKRVGPDLTTIGASRTSQDLLESIIFPSSTIVRQYEPYTLVTVNGRTYSGLVVRDTADSVVIQQATGEPVTVARNDVDELIPATASIMPKGLDEELSAQQIADLVAWLQSRR